MPERRKPTPITPALKRKVARLHAAGKTRNAIARELGIAFATVTKICQAAGLTFDRAKTAQAVAARQIDLRAERVAILADLYELTRADIARLKAPQYSYRVVYKDTSETVTDTETPSRDRLNHASTIASFMQTAARLEQVDAGTNLGATHSLLDTLAAGFAAASAGYTP